VGKNTKQIKHLAIFAPFWCRIARGAGHVQVDGAPARPQYPARRLRALSSGSTHLAGLPPSYGTKYHRSDASGGFGPASSSLSAVLLAAAMTRGNPVS
jgi:hypothetical protein